VKQPVALTIAGSDPSGGAGLQADLKTFFRFGVYGEAVVTLLTVQNTTNVFDIRVLDGAFVGAQLDAVLADIPPGAVKTGALGSAEIVEAVAARELPNLVVDPVMISKHGAPLIGEGARRALIEKLIPKAALVTPNGPEAFELTGVEDPREAARRLVGMGARAALVKGGHLDGDAVDRLLANGEFHEFRAARVATPHTHGTGCAYAAAITAQLARGIELAAAVGAAKVWITEAILTNPGLGAGQGPVNHFALPVPVDPDDFVPGGDAA